MGRSSPQGNRILLMCDYYASPLWTADGCTSLDVNSFPLSEPTKRALRTWATRYDSLGSHDWSAEDQEAFDEEGERLWRLVAKELGGAYEVGYFSERSGRTRWVAAA